MKKHCALYTAFTLKPVGRSLQVTAFPTESTHFKLESLVKHVPNTRNAGTNVWQNVQDHQVQSLRPLIIRMLILGLR